MSLIAVLDGLRLGFSWMPLYSLVFHCKMIGGELAGPPARDAARSGSSRGIACPQPLAGQHRWADLAFRAIDGEIFPADFDAPRTPPWRE